MYKEMEVMNPERGLDGLLVMERYVSPRMVQAVEPHLLAYCRIMVVAWKPIWKKCIRKRTRHVRDQQAVNFEKWGDTIYNSVENESGDCGWLLDLMQSASFEVHVFSDTIQQGRNSPEVSRRECKQMTSANRFGKRIFEDRQDSNTRESLYYMSDVREEL